MKARTRRTIEMGSRALAFSIAHPDASPGYATTLARLEERLARARQLVTLQRDGIAQVRAATVIKRELRRKMRRTQLMHLVRVAEGATKGMPELAQKFVLSPEQTPYLEFQASARAMAAEAQTQKELLVQHGLADTLLDSLMKNLDQFDRAVQQGTEARRAHVGASAELDIIADEILHLVKVMDALNRYRFGDIAEVLAEWESASNVFGPVQPAADQPETPEQPSTGGEARPAA
jgi:hypothetical protein